MPKTWEQLTESEKIEDLRRDVVRIFARLRDFDDRMVSQGQNLNRVEKIALRAAKAVEELKAQQSSKGGGTGA